MWNSKSIRNVGCFFSALQLASWRLPANSVLDFLHSHRACEMAKHLIRYRPRMNKLQLRRPLQRRRKSDGSRVPFNFVYGWLAGWLAASSVIQPVEAAQRKASAELYQSICRMRQKAKQLMFDQQPDCLIDRKASMETF